MRRKREMPPTNGQPVGSDGRKAHARQQRAELRGFGLSPRDVARLKAEVEERGAGKRIYVPNPHNKGFYYYLIETLKALGVNRAHPVAVVVAKFRELTNAPGTAGPNGRTF